MDMGIVREIMDIIANGYGSTPSGMDRSIATNVLAHLQRKGWASPTDIAYLVEAAGGEITLTDEIVGREAPLLQWTRDPMTNDVVLRTRESLTEDKRTEMIQNASVNPEAEQRIRPAAPIMRC